MFLFALEPAVERSPDAGDRAAGIAVDHIHANLTGVVTLADLAAEAGVTARSLQRAFRRKLGCSPLQYLRERRLEAAHRDLCAGAPGGDSVTDVALRYGFAHLGRFAETYRAEYGERPSETLRGR